MTFYIFANLFNVCLNRKQPNRNEETLASELILKTNHIIYSLWKTALYAYQKMRAKEAD